jgi:hypothetical protein
MIRLGILLVSLLGLASDTVTFDLGQFINANHVRVFVFSGTVSSRAGGETVDVLGRDCGTNSDRLIAGTHSSPGGAWRVEMPPSEPPFNFVEVYSGTAFRARWNGDYSAPILWRLPAQPRVARIGRTRTWVVHILPATPTGRVSLQNKPIELQRRSPGGWVRVRGARLVRKADLEWGAFNYQARFTVPTRGLRLRAYLPEQSAAPCYLPGASATWRS